MYKFCAFDLDGTLVNSVGDIAAAMNFCLRDWGLPEHEKGEYNYFVGNGMKKLCERALPDGKKQLTDELVKKYNLRYSEHCCEMSEPYPGMPQLVKRLIAQGVTVAVVTNKPQNQTDRVIARYYGDIPFAEVLGASDDFPPKPAPDMLRSVMQKLGFEAKDMLYIGDSNVDVQFAHSVGSECVGVSWGFRGTAELLAAGADHIADTAEQVYEFAERG